MPFKNRLQAALFNHPLLVDPSFMPILAKRAASQIAEAETIKIKSIAADWQLRRMSNQAGAAVITISGFLFYHADPFMENVFGDTSYETIREQFQAALSDPSVRSIVFRIDSMGGEANGVFDLADDLFRARGTKPIYAVIDDNAASAAYLIASAADKRFISRTGMAGSVGVLMMHVDQSKLDEDIGLAYTPIFAGARKIDFSSHFPLSPEALAVAQSLVDENYALFVSTVARNLGMTPEQIQGTEAGLYMGKKAVDVGYADGVMSWNQFMLKLQNRKIGGIMKAGIERLFNEMRDKLRSLMAANPDDASLQADCVTRADAETLIAQAEAAGKTEGEKTGYEKGLEAGRKEGIELGKQEANTRILAINEICVLAKMEAAAMDYVMDASLSAEKVREKVIEAQAAAADALKLRSTVGALSTGAANPLLADAQKRAAEAGIKIVK